MNEQNKTPAESSAPALSEVAGSDSSERETWLRECIMQLVSVSGITEANARIEAEAWLDDTLGTDTTDSTPEQAAEDIMSYWTE